LKCKQGVNMMILNIFFSKHLEYRDKWRQMRQMGTELSNKW